MRSIHRVKTVPFVLVALLCLTSQRGLGDDIDTQAVAILDASGTQGGLIVHVGCGDGRLTAALRRDERSIVLGLDTVADNVRAARRHVQSLGRLGKITIVGFDGQRLPLADNLANLIVVSGSNGQVSLMKKGTGTTTDSGLTRSKVQDVAEPVPFFSRLQVPEAELRRVLAPGGVALQSIPDARNPNPILLVRKPWPDEIDQWTHFLHDASGNAVAHDAVVAAPRSLQWADGPLWSRSHEYDSSLCAMVSAQGRMFSIFDEGPTGMIDPRIPDRWTLIARDAFNGVVLWKRPIEDWGWKAWRPQMADIDWRRMPSYRCASPLTVPRRLVAVGDRVYTTLGYHAPLTALDAATGQTLMTYPGTEHTDEILFHEGRLVLCLRPPAEQPAQPQAGKRRGAQPSPAPARLMVIDVPTGKQLWQTAPLPVTGLSLAAAGDAVFCHSGNAVLSFDLNTGQQRWQAPVGAPGIPLVVYDETVMCVGQKQLIGLAAVDGSQSWQLPAPRGYGVANPPDLFVADGLAWFGQAGADANSINGYDPRTGELARTIDYGPLATRGHHARCYRSKATDNFLLLPKRAVEFVDLHGDQHSRNNWVRGACRYGVLPCNGLLYSTPHPCFCYAGVKLGGFLALAPERSKKGQAGGAEATGRLLRGPAYEPLQSASAPAQLRTAADWPAYRHDPLRSGSVRTEVTGTVGIDWSAELGGKLTQPVVADGRMIVARVDAGMVCCLDAATGNPIWDFLAGGRIDSSPTCYRDRVMFGSADGSVYCLRAADGELAWRFFAAPEDRRLVAFGQIESVWPVHGSVLLFNDVVYFTAGRSSFLDGGITVYGLHPITGEKLHQTQIDGPHPNAAELDEAAYAMEGAKSDILVTDGQLIYLYHNAFDAALNRIPTPVLGEPGVRNLGERQFGQHLFANAGFLDDSWFSRNQWMLGDHWTGFNFAHQAPKEGELVVFDDTHAYALKCYVRRNTLSPLAFPATDGYFLVADRTDTEPVLVNPRQQPEFLRWLPQEGELQKCWNLDVGFARGNPPEWIRSVPLRVRAMVRTANAIFAAGPPDVCDPDDPLAAIEGRRGAVLMTIDASDGQVVSECQLASPPVFDGLSAAAGRLYLATIDGNLVCLSGP